MSGIPIRKKLALLFGVPTLVIVANIAVVGIALRALPRAVEVVSTAMEHRDQNRAVLGQAGSLAQRLGRFLDRPPENFDDWLAATLVYWEAVDEGLTVLDLAGPDPQVDATRSEIVGGFVSLSQARFGASVAEDSELEDGVILLDASLSSLQDGLGRQGVLLGDVLAKAIESEKRAYQRPIQIAVVSGALSLGLMAFLSVLAGRWLLEPIDRVADGVERIREGDLTAVLSAETHDEIGMLASSFNSMVHKLRGLVAQVRTHAGAVSTGRRELEAETDRMAEDAQRQITSLQDTSAAIGGVAALIDDVVRSTEELSSSATRTSDTAASVRGAVSEVAKDMDRVAETVDNSSASAVELTAAIGQIAAASTALRAIVFETNEFTAAVADAVEQLRERGQESRATASEANRAAVAGLGSAETAASGMGKIAASFSDIGEAVQRLGSRKDAIGDIAAVIEEVARESSLLGLNATIIAAQSGGHGRAFSVVAVEMKELAARSSSSANEIRDLISGVQSDISEAIDAGERGRRAVSDGAERAREAGDAFAQVRDRTVETEREFEQILKVTDETEHQIQALTKVSESAQEIAQQLESATGEQERACADIRNGLDGLHSLAGKTRDDLKVQEQGSEGIAGEARDVAANASAIQAATGRLRDESQRIAAALPAFEESCADALKRADDIRLQVSALARPAQALEEEVDGLVIHSDEL